MLTVYRRHLKGCERRGEGRKYRRCRCPLHVEGTMNGIMTRSSLGTRDWERAQEMVRDWEALGKVPLPKEDLAAPVVTVAQACEQFLADARARNLALSSIYKYDLLLRRLKEFAITARIVAIADCDFPSLLQFRATWKDNNLAALKKLELLRCFFRFVRDNGWIPENLATRLKNPKVTQAPTLPFTEKNMLAILKAASEGIAKAQASAQANTRRLRALVLLLRYSGLRIGDAVGCPVDRLVDGKLRLYTQKTGTHVHCPLPEFVVKELEAIPQASDRYWFWTGVGTLKGAASGWGERISDLCDEAKVPDGHAHRFRDTFAVELLLTGVPLERVGIMLGHSSVRITEKHYAPWVIARQEQAEADVRRAWARDPVVIVESLAPIVTPSEATNHTPDTRGKEPPVM